MPRLPSKHGLERKYKPWRKGKSSSTTKNKAFTEKYTTKRKLTKAGSLKNQLRSQKRLLSKMLMKEQKKERDEQQSNKVTQGDVEQRIKDIEKAIEEKEKKEREKKLANKYHSIKFFERQKLTRMERKALKSLNEAKAAADFDDIAKYKSELEEICMDELYVAYFPNDTKYMALFEDGVRIVDDERTAKRRERTRKDILEKVKKGEIDCKNSWINTTFLNLNMECKKTKEGLNMIESQGINLKESEFNKRASYINEEDGKKPDKDITAKVPLKRGIGNDLISDSSSDSSSESSSEEESKETLESTKVNLAHHEQGSYSKSTATGGKNRESDSSDGSESDTSNSIDSDGNDGVNNEQTSVGKNNTHKELQANRQESDDDFLVDGDDGQDILKPFVNNVSNELTSHRKSGDKSKGWETQKQRPGQWKKRRVR